MNRLVVVSNRVPVPQAGAAPGGLAVALGGLMERRGGFWFGWSGTVSDQADRLSIAGNGDVQYATIDLTRSEHEHYYNGFSNGVLWPLLHSMPELMRYDRHDAQVYREVNQRLVSVLATQLRPTDVIWLHDYHVMAMPALLRAHGVVAPIGFISDHMEVVYDLDVEAAARARELGIRLVRATTVGTDPRFVAMIGELYRERTVPGVPRRSLGALGPAHDRCPARCCLAPDAVALPAIGGGK